MTAQLSSRPIVAMPTRIATSMHSLQRPFNWSQKHCIPGGCEATEVQTDISLGPAAAGKVKISIFRMSHEKFALYDFICFFRWSA